MNTVKILSGFLACAVISSACCSSVLAQGNVKADIGDNGVVTYTFSGITKDDTANITSEDGNVKLFLGRSNGEGDNPNGSYTDEMGNLFLGTTDKYTQSKNVYPDDCGDYIEISVKKDGEYTLTGENFAYWKNKEEVGYGKDNYSIDASEGDIILIGYRPYKDDYKSYVSSITFTPDKYSEAYKFNIAADKIAEKELVVEYTDSGDNFTAAKNLSDLIKTQFAGTGEVLLTGLKFNDIPNTVNIESVTIR